MEKAMQVVSVFIVTVLLLAIVLQAGYGVDLKYKLEDADEDIYDYKVEDVEQEYIIETLRDTNRVLQQEVSKWMELYNEYEPEVIYRTEYRTIYKNRYIDNAIFDVDRDGVVDYHDAAEVLWYIKYGSTIIENLVFQKYGNPYEKLYDVNRDGKVNTTDIDLIWEYSD